MSPTHRPARRRARVVSLEQLTPSRSGVFLPTTQIVRDVKYGPNPRNRLDLYLPRGCAYQGEVVVDAPGASPRATPDANGDPGGKGRPVIVFVTGGMWIIGYKAWGALLAQTLMARGFIVASLDYRNFPQGTVGDMIQDVGAGIGWVSRRAASLGGDPSRVFVVGQSAGAHLAATAMLRQSEWERGDLRRGSSPWSPKSLAGFVGISGVYAPDDGKLVEHFNTKGLYREVFYSIMEAGFSGSRAEEALPRREPVRHPSGTVDDARARGGATARALVPWQRGHLRAAVSERGLRRRAALGRGEGGHGAVLPRKDAHGSLCHRSHPRRKGRTSRGYRGVRAGRGGAVRDGKVSGDACAASEAARRHRQDHGAVLGGSVRRRGRVLVGRRAARFRLQRVALVRSFTVSSPSRERSSTRIDH